MHLITLYGYLCGSGSSVGIATRGWTVRGSNPGGARFSARPDSPGAHPASCTMGTGSFPGVKYGRGVLLTTHPLLVPRSWKSRAIPLPTLWATSWPVTGTLYLYLCMGKYELLHFRGCKSCAFSRNRGSKRMIVAFHNLTNEPNNIRFLRTVTRHIAQRALQPAATRQRTTRVATSCSHCTK